jgi:hypothetical protein
MWAVLLQPGVNPIAAKYIYIYIYMCVYIYIYIYISICATRENHGPLEESEVTQRLQICTCDMNQEMSRAWSDTRKTPSVLYQIRNNKDNWMECIEHMQVNRYQKFALHCHPTPRRDPGRPRKDRKRSRNRSKGLSPDSKKRKTHTPCNNYKPYYTTRWSFSKQHT